MCNKDKNQDRIIVLASASPRRKELLEKIGLRFTVDPSNCQEELDSGLPPEKLVIEVSRSKASAVAEDHPDAVIIAADTLGVLHGRIIGKPRDAGEARRMLSDMSGRSHRVITGLTVLDTRSRKQVSRTVETRVYFKKLTPEEIVNYVNSGEPLDKAGAYAIQGLGSLIVEKISGDYYNVVGLPLNALSEILKDFGISIL